MNLRPGSTQRSGDSIVPMINVAFLMLIFFLMMAQITPPDAIDVIPPTAAGEEPEDVGDILLIGADGELAYKDVRGDAVFAVIGRRSQQVPLRLKAASEGQGGAFASILSRLSESGVTRAELVVVRP